MANRPGRAFRIGSIIWAFIIGTGIIALGVSVLLPSTKRARVHFPQPGEAETEPTRGPVMMSTKRAAFDVMSSGSAQNSPTMAPATEPTTQP